MFTLPTDYTKLNPYERRIVRLLYIEKQNHKCYYCGEDIDKLPPI